VSALAEAARRTRRRADGIAGPGKMAGVRVRGPVPTTRHAAVLLASEGREFSNASIERAAELAGQSDRTVFVLSTARVHGVAFGIQTPGLAPTKTEWEEQRKIVEKAVKRLRRMGLDVQGQVLGTRSPAKRICALALELRAEQIVMGADRRRPWLLSSMMWSQEPHHVQRRAKVGVHLAIEPT
jgi:nucleotide-binding universal stress UspA family protein